MPCPDSSTERISRLERRLRRLTVACLSLALLCAGAFWIAVRPLPVHAQNSPEILRVRGLVVEDAEGRARIILGAPVPSVQERKRTERGGFGFLDNGTVSLGLDYANAREAVTLSVLPKAGFAGMMIHAPQGSKSERAEVGVLTDGTSLMKLADTTGAERAMMIVQGENPAKLLGISPRETSGFDVGVSWLNPSVNRHLVVETGQKFMEDIRNVKP